MVPARICGVSMLPPNRSGTSELRTSFAGRGHTDRPEHRRERQVDGELAVPGLELQRAARAVEMVDPRRVGQRILQRRSAVGASQPAEERDRGRRRPVARRLDADEVQRERVAGLGALDVERPGLRVHEAQVDLLARQIVSRCAARRRKRPPTTAEARVPGVIRRIGARAAERDRRAAQRSA